MQIPVLRVFWPAGTDFAVLTDREQAQWETLGGMLGQAFGTASLVDVGSWFRDGRVCIGLVPDGVALFAPGPRPYAERLDRNELQDSMYNHVTGELVLAPAETACIRQLRVPPLKAEDLLKHIRKKEVSHA